MLKKNKEKIYQTTDYGGTITKDAVGTAESEYPGENVKPDLPPIVQSGEGSSPTFGSGKVSDTGTSYNYGDFNFRDYAESDAVGDAYGKYQAHLGTKPVMGGFSRREDLDNIITAILNGEEFTFDLNGDAIYQQYKDKALTRGKMAMADAMGQASAMTGGFGNSYAQSVGQQMFQKELQDLNDVIPELYQMAYDRHNDKKEELYKQYAMLGDLEALEYDRHRDEMADWLAERDYLRGVYDSERDFDYGKYADERAFEYAKHRDDVSDGQWQAENLEALLNRAKVADDDVDAGIPEFDYETYKQNVTGNGESYIEEARETVKGFDNEDDVVAYLMDMYFNSFMEMNEVLEVYQEYKGVS